MPDFGVDRRLPHESVGMASRIVRFMRRQNLPVAHYDWVNQGRKHPSVRMAEGFAARAAIAWCHEERYGACSTRCRIEWRHDHARPYALDKLVSLAIGASHAGHRDSYLGLDPAAAAGARAEAAIAPHFRHRRAQTLSVVTPTAFSTPDNSLNTVPRRTRGHQKWVPGNNGLPIHDRHERMRAWREALPAVLNLQLDRKRLTVVGDLRHDLVAGF